MQINKLTYQALAILTLALLIGPAISQAGITFEAKSESSTAGVSPFPGVRGEIKGYVKGEKGQVKFSPSEAGGMPEGSVVITGDGGVTSWLFDPRKKTCLKWPGQFAARNIPESFQINNLKVEKLLEEEGENIADRTTVHYRFQTSFETEAANGSKWSNLLIEDFWVTDTIEQPTLSFWLEKAPGGNVDPESYQKISEIVSVSGTVLKRSSKLLVESGDGRKMEGIAKFEVTRIAESEVTEADLEVPAACRDSVRGRKL